jgi:predicted metal-dependent TIM-barrel fold hydrolase
LNKVKSQLTNAATRIEELDQEWSSFVQKTMEKVKQHAAMYQSCRADLLEAYNTKLEELSMLKKEMTEASLSMLAPAVTVAPMEKSVDVEKQIHSLEEVIDIESVVGAVDLTDDMDDEVPMGGEALQPASVCPRIPSLFVGRHLQQR